MSKVTPLSARAVSALVMAVAASATAVATTWTPVPQSGVVRAPQMVQVYGAVAALKADGSVVTWGRSALGGDSSSVASDLSSGVERLFSSLEAFAALKTDGSVVAWGQNGRGGTPYGPAPSGSTAAAAGSLSSGVVDISSTESAFAARKADGSVVAWGRSSSGGAPDCSASNQCAPVPAGSLSSGVSRVYSSSYAFAALKSGGELVTWGYPGAGGDSTAVASSLASGVVDVRGTAEGAFAALKSDGSVVAWGDSAYGGDSSSVSGHLGAGVVALSATDGAFAALKSDGSAVAWGDSAYGGDASSVSAQLASGVTGIVGNRGAFVAQKADGSVVAWGGDYYGGNVSSSTSGVVNPPAGTLASGVASVLGSGDAFAALKTDGSVVTWGYGASGGDSSLASGSLGSGVTALFSGRYTFAALKADGSLVTWGDPAKGGDSSSVAPQLQSGVEFVVAGIESMAAMKADGSLVVWGTNGYGGSPYGPAPSGATAAAAGSLASGVVGVQSPLSPFFAPLQRSAPSASAGEASATVTVAAAPTPAGPAVASHVITAIPGGATCSISAPGGSCTMTGLSAGVSYSFTDTAVNPGGIATASAPSAPVVPSAAPAPANPSAAGGPTASGPSAPAGQASPAPRVRRLSLQVAPSPVYGGTTPSGAATPTSLRTVVVAPGAGTVRQIAYSAATGTERPGAHAAVRRATCSSTTQVSRAGAVTVSCALSTWARRTLRTRAIRARVVTTFIGSSGMRARSVRVVVIPRSSGRAASGRGAVTG